MHIKIGGKPEMLGTRAEPFETSKWWQWILSFDKSNNPLNGSNVDQALPFVCLACTGGGEDLKRKLRIEGKDVEKEILIPIFTSEYSTAELGIDASNEKLLRRAKDDVKDPEEIELTINGNSAQNFEEFYVEAGPFTVQLPSQHILDDEKIMPGRYRAMCAGYWMKINPPSGGDYQIEFGGTGRNGFHTKVRYSIEVPALVVQQLEVK